MGNYWAGLWIRASKCFAIRIPRSARFFSANQETKLNFNFKFPLPWPPPCLCSQKSANSQHSDGIFEKFICIEQRTIFRQVTIFCHLFLISCNFCIFHRNKFISSMPMKSKYVFTQQIKEMAKICFNTLQIIVVKYCKIWFPWRNMVLCSTFQKRRVVIKHIHLIFGFHYLREMPLNRSW